ncbi:MULTISPECIES: DUF5709 domain-containing protein [unclassified Streptomyces]|uniref:DUF5709 domain-containing protein n=1 Tax=unclassified Streptomyces TaxID=2593676 RepID=UPI002250DBCD|nr:MULTISPECIES: DUF5709 domain-containing protein [unclassified Streptomyces]WSP58455.1 DUF5709 domain-containing protein [Streptomyces sp. NBC_01241]WSU20971.1 DUF5709 domain-containing protein [Streptomyces sp. NBC_01108]MCX4790217.1 DUF5709 domain-containing protein [Streptomyces sp. NBC_01221]MCX4794054.1 DUF5709 domain-containing protein [Streptomyces sp. NBC_01242]WSJ35462.1 DUF5709 domain-containing protein [Streptomyces sp. NBC_01321]
MKDGDMGDDVYQPQEPEASDPTEQLDIEDTLDNRGLTDLLDEGYSPPERPWAVEDQGTTAAEQHSGEPLESRLARELPEVNEAAGDDVGDLSDGDGELWDAEVGTVRAGRLTRQLDINEPDTLTAEDVGIDGAAASAEEAAMHVVRDSQI